MYKRFVTLKNDEDSRKKQGLFMATRELRDEGELDRYELETANQIFEWFNENVDVPSFQKKDGCNRCISWFKPEAKEALEKMWELYHLLQSKGVAVEVLKSDDVGEIHYKDKHQIIAQPYRHNRKRHY
jgi:hypothetical protein